MHSYELLYLFLFASFLLSELISCNYYENNYWWRNTPSVLKKDGVAIQPKQRVPDWAIAYNKIAERRRQYLEDTKYRSTVYPAPYINRIATKPRTRQPQPLLNRGQIMDYFYNRNKKYFTTKKPQFTISLQQRSLTGPKVQYFSIYPPVSPATPYYPSLKELFKKSFYSNMLKRQRRNKKLQMQNFFPGKADWRFATASRKDYTSAINNFQASMPMYTYPYQQHQNQYKSQVLFLTNPYNSNTIQRDNSFGLKYSLPTQQMYRNVSNISQPQNRSINSIKQIVWDKKNNIPKIQTKEIPRNLLIFQNNTDPENTKTQKTFMTKKDVIMHVGPVKNTSLDKRANISKVSSAAMLTTTISLPWTRAERHHIFHPISPATNNNIAHNQVQKERETILPITKSNIGRNQVQNKTNTTNAYKREFLPYDSETDSDDRNGGDGDGDVPNDDMFNANEGDRRENSYSPRSFPNDDDNKDYSEDVDDLNDNEEVPYNPSESQQPELSKSEYMKQETGTDPETIQSPQIPDENSSSSSSSTRKLPEETIDKVQQSMMDNIATARGGSHQENIDQNVKQESKNGEKNSMVNEESEAVKEDKEAEKLITSKDKFRMDDQPEILDINKNGVSSTADKASISASFANSLTQNERQDNRVGVDTMDPFVNREMHQSPIKAFEQDEGKMDSKEFPTVPGELRENFQEEEYLKSNPHYTNGHVKSSPSHSPETLAMESMNDHNTSEKPDYTNVEDLDPMEIDRKNDEEKNALLDPEKAQERAYKLATEREMEKKLKKAPNESSNSGDSHPKQTTEITGSNKSTQNEPPTEMNLSPEDALNALNGGQLPSEHTQEYEATKDELPKYHKTDPPTTNDTKSSLNTITSPTNEPLKNPVEQKNNASDKSQEEKPDGIKANDVKTPVVENAAVSKEVVDLLKSLGQIRSPPDKKEDATKTSSNNNKEENTSTPTNATHDVSVDNEEKETKEAVHDLGIAIGILEKKLVLINEAKITGNKKSIFIVDDPNSSNVKDEKVASKSTIELDNSMRLLRKVMNVAQRFKNKDSFSNRKSNVHDSKRDQISSRSSLVLQQPNFFNKQSTLSAQQPISFNKQRSSFIQQPIPIGPQEDFVRSPYTLSPATMYETNQYAPYLPPLKKSNIMNYNSLEYEHQPYYTGWNNFDETYW